MLSRVKQAIKKGYTTSCKKTQMEKVKGDAFMPLWRKKHKRLKDNAECKHKEEIHGDTKKKTSPKNNDHKQGSGGL